jgi:glycerol-3-phosphate acyltransferase PlsX
VRIALDAMGTDRHPAVEVEGAVQALRELPADFEIVLVGDRDRIAGELRRWPDAPANRLEILHAPDTINPGDAAASAVRRKPNSSIVMGLSLQREGRADAFVSAGSTGAVMAASLLLLRPLPGVDRPAVGTILPTSVQPCLLIDAGANVDCKPNQLLQFARLGAIYVEDVWRRPTPRIGLLNIGEEPEKGDELSAETHRLLRASEMNFVGNVEGRDIIKGVCDVLVADGFVGNVVLKFYESVMGFDYTEYGGAPLLGVNGVSIICHGGSPPRAIRNALRVARQAVETKMVGHIERVVAELGDRSEADAAVAAGERWSRERARSEGL